MMRLFILLTLINSILFPLVLGSRDYPQNPADVLSIQYTLAHYTILIDSKNFDGLSDIFTSDAYTEYPLPVVVPIGPPAIIKSLRINLANFTTQHSLTTQLVNVLSKDKAESQAYFIATPWQSTPSLFEGFPHPASHQRVPCEVGCSPLPVPSPADEAAAMWPSLAPTPRPLACACATSCSTSLRESQASAQPHGRPPNPTA